MSAWVGERVALVGWVVIAICWLVGWLSWLCWWFGLVWVGDLVGLDRCFALVWCVGGFGASVGERVALVPWLGG